ncbi:hypothetical protein V6N11_065932 [Hibiscus sabdariffa]|uniref:Uncharacterized protein n=2 Tax=Hibiscus sabdariffa TaxID=183260 RepID=A0ABR2G4K3_9ROSI
MPKPNVLGRQRVMDQAGLTRADQLSTLPLLDRTVNGSGLAHWFNPSSPQLDWVTNGRGSYTWGREQIQPFNDPDMVG